MPCTAKKTFACATATGNALLVRVKGNQPRLRDALVALCAGRAPSDRLETVDRGRHGRQEHRRVEVFAVDGRLDPDWRPWIACAARVARLSWCKGTVKLMPAITERCCCSSALRFTRQPRHP